MISLLRDQKIGSRLFGSFFVMVALMGTIAIVALVQTGSVNYLVSHGRTISTRLTDSVEHLKGAVDLKVPVDRKREMVLMRLQDVTRVSLELVSYAPIFQRKSDELERNAREMMRTCRDIREELEAVPADPALRETMLLEADMRVLSEVSDGTVDTIIREIDKSLTSATRTALVLLGGGSLIGLFLALTQGWNITSRILEISRVSRQVARGNFDVFVPITPKVEDEVSELNETFNLMTYELGMMNQEIERYSRHLNEMVAEKTKALRETNVQLKSTMDRLETANEQLVQAAQLRTDFLARMSHELVTPLNAIMGFAEILTDGSVGALTAQQAEFLQDILQSAGHLRQMIRDLLDIAQVEAGHVHLNKELVNVYFWLFYTQKYVGPRAEEKNITLKLEVPNETLEVYADQSRLNQVINNLLANAIKYTPEGGTVTTRAWQEDDRLYVSVTDTGIGIPEKYHEKIFDAFQHIQQQISRKHFGPGLGLALVKSFVEMHGGRVSVQSDVGKSSTFTFWLPLRAEDLAAAPVVEEAAPEVEAPVPNNVKTVVVCTANRTLADIVDMYLREAGYAVEKTTPGEPTVATTLGMMPFAVIIDLDPTNEDAWETLEHIRDNTETRRLPIFLILDRIEKSITARTRRLGVTDTLTKPVDRFELICALANIREEAPASAAPSASVLVVDGDALNRRLIAGGLRRIGFSVTEAEDGQECVQSVTSSPPDVIAMDIDLPNTSASEVIIAIRRQPRTAALPIVIMANRELTEEEKGAISGKIYRTLRKGPEMIEQLGNIVKGLFEK